MRPDVRHHSSWVVGAAEFAGAHMDGASLANDVDVATLMRDDAFADLVARLRAEADEDAPRPDGRVPATALWMIDRGELVGFLEIRHRLTPVLEERGGHIGYSVRPSARRRGHATAALAAALPIARDLGLDRVLVLCEESNTGSRAVIERNGGVHEDTRAGLRRYWLDTAPSRSSF